MRHRSGVADLTRRLILIRYPGLCDSEQLVWCLAGFLHDTGKEVIDKRYPGLLDKASTLTPEEWDIVKKHTSLGYDVLRQSYIKEIASAAPAALEHHERWDGSGYIGKRGLDICLQGRIVAVADVYDALCHDRPYRKAWSREDALEYMEQNKTVLFDPEWVDALMLLITGQDSPAV